MFPLFYKLDYAPQSVEIHYFLNHSMVKDSTGLGGDLGCGWYLSTLVDLALASLHLIYKIRVRCQALCLERENLILNFH